MADTRIHDTLTRLQATISAIKDSSPGAREQLISVCETVITDLELPSEAIQRFGWAEVSVPFERTRMLSVLTENNGSPLAPPI